MPVEWNGVALGEKRSRLRHQESGDCGVAFGDRHIQTEPAVQIAIVARQPEFVVAQELGATEAQVEDAPASADAGPLLYNRW